MRLHDARRAVPERSVWGFFPWWVCASMGVVIAVNAFMVYSALHTFPGQAGQDGFDLSNKYDQVLDRVERQAALGWTIRARVDESGHPLLALTDATGTPLTGAKLEAVAERPVGDPRTTSVAFREAAPGRYAGESALPAKGQWDLLLTATAEGHAVTTTRRIVAW